MKHTNTLKKKEEKKNAHNQTRTLATSKYPHADIRHRSFFFVVFCFLSFTGNCWFLFSREIEESRVLGPFGQRAPGALEFGLTSESHIHTHAHTQRSDSDHKCFCRSEQRVGCKSFSWLLITLSLQRVHSDARL